MQSGVNGWETILGRSFDERPLLETSGSFPFKASHCYPYGT